MSEPEMAEREPEVNVPWIDEPLPLSEAVETVANTVEDDAERWERLEERVGEFEEIENRIDELDRLTERIDDLDRHEERIDALERRAEALEDGTAIECPSCGSADDVLKAGVAAGKLASEGALSEANVDALNAESHVCLACSESFTPAAES